MNFITLETLIQQIQRNILMSRKVSFNYLLEMNKVIIIVNAEVNPTGTMTLASPTTNTMVAGLQRAINSDSAHIRVEVLPSASLWSKALTLRESEQNLIYCPLTIEIPPQLSFPGQKIYQSCKDIYGRRKWVEENLGFKTSIGNAWLGDLWLPVVLTDHETLYQPIIGEGFMPNSYEQPINLNHKVYKSLHYLADQFLESFDAPPSVYLLQFSLIDNEIVFDRFWPFPAAPAIASLKQHAPDLFTQYWNCLSEQPAVKSSQEKSVRSKTKGKSSRSQKSEV